MSKSGDINAASLHRCVNCPQCGYLLDGLPLTGKCPECGFEYSPDVIVIYGVGSGRKMRVPWRNSIFWIGGWIAIGVGTSFLPVWFQFSSWNNVIWILLLLLACVAYQYIARREMPDACELVLTPFGFGIREGRGEVLFTKWAAKYQIKVRPHWFYSGRYELRIEYRAFFYDRNVMTFIFAADATTATQVFNRIHNFRNAAVNRARGEPAVPSSPMTSLNNT